MSYFTPTYTAGATDALEVNGLTSSTIPTDMAGVVFFIDDVPEAGIDYLLFGNTLKGAASSLRGGWLYQERATPVPEPATLSLLTLGLGGAALRRFRRRR